jgi:hypothetical protein
MMLSLILYIFYNQRRLRSANGKCPVSILPRKLAHSCKFIVNPHRGISFEKLSYLAGSQYCWRLNQSMNVILDTANLKSRSFMLSGNASDIFPQSLLDLRMDPAQAIFRTKDKVIQEGRVGVCHFGTQWFYSPVADATDCFAQSDPGLERPG